MPHSIDQILPSLQSLGLWSYWILAMCAMLEAIVLTGFIVPGAFAVIAGGILVQRGAIDFFDLAWFVFAGTVLGSEVSFRLGRLVHSGLAGRDRLAQSPQTARAQRLLLRYGGFAMVIGRFFDPLSAFVPFSAAMARMSHLRFTAWNVVSALPYALGLPALGYVFGTAFVHFGAAAPRIALFAIVLLAFLALLWLVVVRLRRALPFLLSLLTALGRWIESRPAARALAARYPRGTRLILRRFDHRNGSGLLTTALVAAFVYVLALYLDSVFDFLRDSAVSTLDTRLANLIYAFRDERLVVVFSWITGFGSWKAIACLLLAATAALALARRTGSLIALWTVVIGNQVMVTLLKGAFGRPRSSLGYFAESSHSFPSGHSASSVAIWGMLFFLAWRTRLLPGLWAGLAAITTAFLIGVSRLYLVEHYLSDVVNGWLVGALWLLVGISVCEWWDHRRAEGPRPLRAPLPVACLALGVAGAVVVTGLSSPELNPAPAATLTTVEDVSGLLGTQSLPREVTDIGGSSQGRIDALVLAEGEPAVVALLEGAGWSQARTLSLGLLAQSFWADWRDDAAPAGLLLPAFWDNRPNDLAFTRGESGGQLRLWETDREVAGSGRVFVVTVTPPGERASQSGDEAALTQLLQDATAAGASVSPADGPGRLVVLRF